MDEKQLFATPTGATFSRCRRYRYLLWRRWSDAHLINFCMLNPSTADELRNDPTVERCERRARATAYGGLIVTNIFAFRATDPRVMAAAEDPIGPGNDAALRQAAQASEMVVCAWGNHGLLRGRSSTAIEVLRAAGTPLFALRVAKTGEPCHPLYLPYELKLVAI